MWLPILLYLLMGVLTGCVMCVFIEEIKDFDDVPALIGFSVIWPITIVGAAIWLLFDKVLLRAINAGRRKKGFKELG